MSRNLMTTPPASAGTAAQADVGTAPGNVVQLDEHGRLPGIDGSQLTGLTLTESLGTETAVTPAATSSHSKLDAVAETFVPIAPPNPLPATNHAFTPVDYVDYYGDGDLQGEVDVLGGTGRRFRTTPMASRFVQFAEMLSVSSGDVVYFAVAVKRVSGTGSRRIYAIAEGNTVRVQLNGAALDFENWSTTAPFSTKFAAAPTTANDAFCRVTEVGDVSVVQGRFTATAGVIGAVGLGVGANTLNDTVDVLGIYMGLEPYDPFATDGSEAVLLPASLQSATLTLGDGPAYAATVESIATQIILASAPATGPRVTSLNVTIDGGSLVLPTANVFRIGDTPAVIDESSRVFIWHYPDGTIHIVAGILTAAS